MDSVSLKRDAAVTVVSLPIAAIVGIAVGGAVILFLALTAVAVVLVRRKHRREKNNVTKVEAGENTVEKKRPANAQPPPAKFALSRRLSFNPFIPIDDDPTWNDWPGENGLGTSPRRRSRRLSPPKGAFRMSGMRDSWPLVSNIPLSLMPQSSSNIQLSNVAAPGYEIFTEPKWPKRTLSRNSRTTVSVSRESPSPRKRPAFNDPYSPTRKPAKRNPHIRSASENQLSTILRSTSQRLKAANRNPLTRTLTTLNRTPGSPPIQPLPRSPKGKPSESREQLIDSDNEESVASSVYDLLRSPSLSKRKSRRSVQLLPTTEQSPTASVASEDSLCVTSTPDLVIPASLTSPSKNGTKRGQRHRMRISSAEARDLSALINRDSQASTLASGTHPNLKRSLSLSAPHRISLASDPFIYEVKSSKPFIPGDQLLGPRPLYIRKTTFGSDRVAQRPQSYTLPLQHISGNSRMSPKKPHPPPHRTPELGNADQNPFQWSTQEIMHTRSTPTSPSRKRGHKRSKVVRISQIPRPLSVAVVPEEPEEEQSPLRFSTASAANYRFSDIELKSPSPAIPSKDERRLSTRPPSVTTFNPSFTDLTRSGDNSPTIGMQEILNMYSPTLAGNYYTESPVTSEEDFFARAVHSPVSPSRAQSYPTGSPSGRRHSRNVSTENLFPSTPQQPRLVSFPPPELSPTVNPRDTHTSLLNPPPSPRPSPRPLPQISTIYSPTAPPMFMQPRTTLSSPLPPLLTIAVPGHLTGPRAEPIKRPTSTSSFTSFGAGSLFSAPKETLETTIDKLRRMNSDITTLNSNSAASSNPVSTSVSPMVPGLMSHSRISSQDSPIAPLRIASEEERRGRSRGSKNYLSVGFVSSKSSPSFLLPFTPTSQIRSQAPRQRRGTMSGAEKRSSEGSHQERRKRRNEDVEGTNVDDFLRGRGLKTSSHMLTPVKEVRSSPASAHIPTPASKSLDSPTHDSIVSGQMTLKFPTLTVTGSSNASKTIISGNEQPARKRATAMSTMMGIGSIDDFFKAENFVAVDASAFEVGSDTDSETNTETTEEIAPAKNDIQSPGNSLSVSKDNQYRDSLLDLYSHTPTPSPRVSAMELSPRAIAKPPPIITTTNHPQFTNPHTTAPARWSDATPKPPGCSIHIRRESKMEHPKVSPRGTPPAWVWKDEGLGLGLLQIESNGQGTPTPTPSPTRSLLVEEEWEGKEDAGRALRGEMPRVKVEGVGSLIEGRMETEVKEVVVNAKGRETPVNVGLYDQEGFYVSPDRRREKLKEGVVSK